jgi:hypothetical protein
VKFITWLYGKVQCGRLDEPWRKRPSLGVDGCFIHVRASFTGHTKLNAVIARYTFQDTAWRLDTTPDFTTIKVH